MRRACLLALLLALLLGSAQAARIVIDAAADPNSRLEIRTITLPGGQTVQLYVLEGEGLRVAIDDDLLVADHVEFDLTNRLVRVIGPGSFTTGGETVSGEGLVIDLSQESFTASDVFIITDAIDVRGDSASRVPGLIRVAMGEFSLCSRCNQQVEDYGFKAERLELYPGDRLVAFVVTVLIREEPVLNLPLMVLPLAEPDRQPRLVYERGSAEQQARIFVTWPYVAGPDAYGDWTLRYYADVLPGGRGVQQTLLGGTVEQWYLGGAVNHRFYTERGKGVFQVDFTPGFVTPAGVEDHEFQVRFAYADEEALGPPSLSVLLERDDARRERLWEASVAAVQVESGVRARFSTQVFLDLDPGDGVWEPSYASRFTPLMTLARLELEPEDLGSFSIGPLSLDRLLVDIGGFQDVSNPLNRSAAVSPLSTTGRLREAHTVTLAPQDLWSGMRVDGRTEFTGFYYGTAERQVEWLTRLSATQTVGRVASLNLSYRRDVREGETPFRFDVIPYRNRTDITARFLLTPAPWLRFEQTGGYVFVDDRSPGDVGWLPLASTLTLLGNVNWVSLTVRNVYELDGTDPGTIDATLGLRTTGGGPWGASAELRHVVDLAVLPDRITLQPLDETATYLSVSGGLTGIATLSARSAYRYNPPPPEPGRAPDHFDDLELTLTLGTLTQSDMRPGLAITYARDLDEGYTSAFGVEATARIGSLRLSAVERLDLPSGRIANSRLRVELPGYVAAQADGLAWLPPEWLGLPSPAPHSRSVAVSVEAAPESGQPSWQVRFSTTYDPGILGGAGGYRASTLTGRALLAGHQVGPVRFSVDGFAEFQWRDALQPETYLRRANLVFGVQFSEVVGLQGTLGYSAAYSTSQQEVTSARLSLEQVALVVRPLDSLYVGAVFNEVWDLTGNDPTRPPFSARPTVTLVWNRCCWALYGSWNTGTGALSITLTTPGADQGLSQVFETGWLIPRRTQ